MLVTRLVAVETKATYSPSGLMTGLELGPLPAVWPSAEIETSCVSKLELGEIAHGAVVVGMQTGRQYTWVVPFCTGTVETKFVARDVKAACVPAESSVGSELGPFAAFPLGSELTTAVTGTQLANAKQVLRTYTSGLVFRSVSTRLCDTEANATNWPELLLDGPEVVVVRPRAPLAQLATPQQMPLLAWEPSAARSASTGKPSKWVGLMEYVRILDMPPPGGLFTT